MLGVPQSVNITDLLCKSADFLIKFPFINNNEINESTFDQKISFEQLVKLIAIYTNKLNGILAMDYNLPKLLFLSFSDSDAEIVTPEDKTSEPIAFPLKDTDTWNSLEVIETFDGLDIKHRFISAFDLYRLVSFLLAIVEYRSHHRALACSKKFAGDYFVTGPYSQFQSAALCILRAIAQGNIPEREDCIVQSEESSAIVAPGSVEAEWTRRMKNVKIFFPEFERAFHASFPYLFVPLTELFGRLLFSESASSRERDNSGAHDLYDDGYDEQEDEFSEDNKEEFDEKQRRRSLNVEDKMLSRPSINKERSMSYSGGLKPSIPSASASSSNGNKSASTKPKGDIFKREGRTKLITPATMAQLSAMLGPGLYTRLKRLYVGSEAGFSLRSFESRVFKWRAPTLLLVSGREIEVPLSLAGVGSSVGPSGTPIGARERAFNDLIPPLRRLHEQTTTKKHVRRPVFFAAYIVEPWKSHAKNTFGNSESFLIQLEQVQDRFNAEANGPANAPYSTAGKPKHYAYFTRTQPGGIGFGSPVPQSGTSSTVSSFSQSHSGSLGSSGFKMGGSSGSSGSSGSGVFGPRFDLGSVSLTLNESLEYGVFRHVGPGGSYSRTEGMRRDCEFETRFEITEVEVWGSGKDEDLEEQRRRWEWEEREAQYRQRVNIHNIGEERAFLEMAGLVGNHGNGGSMG